MCFLFEMGSPNIEGLSLHEEGEGEGLCFEVEDEGGDVGDL